MTHMPGLGDYLRLVMPLMIAINVLLLFGNIVPILVKVVDFTSCSYLFPYLIFVMVALVTHIVLAALIFTNTGFHPSLLAGFGLWFLMILFSIVMIVFYATGLVEKSCSSVLWGLGIADIAVFCLSAIPFAIGAFFLLSF